METHQHTSPKHLGNLIHNGVVSALVFVVRVYQYLLSPWLGQHCRFTPTCSQFAIDAVKTLGPIKGCGLTARRLCKCHPWHHGGYDPVPTPSKQTQKDGF